jgi:hypothetical protein
LRRAVVVVSNGIDAASQALLTGARAHMRARVGAAGARRVQERNARLKRAQR